MYQREVPKEVPKSECGSSRACIANGGGDFPIKPGENPPMNDARKMDFDPGRRHADRQHFIHCLNHDRFESGGCFPAFFRLVFRLDGRSVRDQGQLRRGLVRFGLIESDNFKQKLAIPLRGRRKLGRQQRIHDGNAGFQLLHERSGHTVLR